MKQSTLIFLSRILIILLIVLLVLLVLLIAYKQWKKSNFNQSGIDQIMSESYYSCGNGSRTDPSGKVPGNYLNLNEYEKNELLRKFVQEKDLNN